MRLVLLSSLFLWPCLGWSSPFVTSRSDLTCLAQMMWAEARGEPKKGQFAVGHAAKNRAKRAKIPLCHVPAKRKGIPKESRSEFLGMADQVLRDRVPDPSGGADSWFSGRRPAYVHAVVARIGGHTFHRLYP